MLTWYKYTLTSGCRLFIQFHAWTTIRGRNGWMSLRFLSDTFTSFWNCKSSQNQRELSSFYIFSCKVTTPGPLLTRRDVPLCLYTQTALLHDSQQRKRGLCCSVLELPGEVHVSSESIHSWRKYSALLIQSCRRLGSQEDYLLILLLLFSATQILGSDDVDLSIWWLAGGKAALWA